MGKLLYVLVVVMVNIQVAVGAAVPAGSADDEDLSVILQRYQERNAESSGTRDGTHLINDDSDAFIELLARVLFRESHKRQTINALRSWNFGNTDTGGRATITTRKLTTVTTTVPPSSTDNPTAAATSTTGQITLPKWLLELLRKYWS